MKNRWNIFCNGQIKAMENVVVLSFRRSFIPVRQLKWKTDLYVICKLSIYSAEDLKFRSNINSTQWFGNKWWRFLKIFCMRMSYFPVKVFWNPRKLQWGQIKPYWDKRKDLAKWRPGSLISCQDKVVGWLEKCSRCVTQIEVKLLKTSKKYYNELGKWQYWY